jgi:LysR family hydrogen peroxide-inducible transcriptional activator
VQLVERDRQSVALTAVGQSVATRARQVLAAAQDLTDFAAAASRPMQGPLRLGVIPTIAPFVLPDVMPILRKKFPGMQLSLREDLTANLLTRLHHRQLDFILIALPIETGELHVRPLYADKFWLVGRKDDLAVSGRAIRLNHEWTERLLLLEEGHCLRDHALQACRAAEVGHAEGIEATSLLTLIQMVASGMGVALLPEMALRHGLIRYQPLQARPLAAPAPHRTIALVTRPTSAHMAAFEAIGQVISAEHARRKRNLA